MAENKMDINEACKIIEDMRWEEDVPGIYACSDRENIALWMACRALEFCKANGYTGYEDFSERRADMVENKMADVAALFGKKLGEMFTVKWGSPDFMFDCRFDEYGLYVLSEPPFSDHFSQRLLYDLLKGRAVIVDD